MALNAADSGECSRCGTYAWTRATWVEAEGTVCARCLPPPRRRRHEEESEDSYMPAVTPKPCDHAAGRRLSKQEAERAYPGRVSPDYGAPWSSVRIPK